MFQKLVSHNEDLKKLVDKGYAVTVDSNYLVIRDIPYVNEKKELAYGAIVSKLEFIDNLRFKQHDHQIYFSGSIPHGIDGRPIPNLGGGNHTIQLSDNCLDVVVQRSFSNKPKGAGKYTDHFHKIETYVGFISGPAEYLFNVNPYTFRLAEQTSSKSVFKFRDTLTSRAEIMDLAEKLQDEVIAIIGLGGTGSYILDYLVKSPVLKILGFDHDEYYIHNSYRSPGRLEESDLGKAKAEVYQSRYENFREGVKLKTKYIDKSSIEELKNVTFVFICVDNGNARSEIIDLLSDMEIPFIDVGMGLRRKDNTLTGMVRTTYFPIEHAQEIRQKKWVSESEDSENLYKTNIQISELNALNACFAVIRYKQIKGFYTEDMDILNLLFNIGNMSNIKE